MNLFTEIADNNTLHSEKINKSIDRPRIRRVDSTEFSGQKLSNLSQFILAPHALIDSSTVTSIPIKADSVFIDLLNEELTPHFEKVLLIEYKDHLEINLSNLKTKSNERFLDLMRNGEVSNLIKNMYGKAYQKKNDIQWEHISKKYMVNLKAIEPQVSEEWDEIWQFIKGTYIDIEKSYLLLPLGWEFDEKFKEKTVVKMLVSACEEMQVGVNVNTNNITYIEIR